MNAAYFEALAAAVCRAGGADRVMLAYAAEATDFVRFNQARVRQATHVEQHFAVVSVVAGQRLAKASVTLSGHAAADSAALVAERDELLRLLPQVPEDAHLLLPDEVVSTSHEGAGALPTAQQVIRSVAEQGAGTDFVGIYTGGPVARGFADSRGQRNWHRVESFLFEWCLYGERDRAAKSTYAGAVWEDGAFAAHVARGRQQLALLALPRRALPPGAWRAYLSPVAMGDLLGTLGWGGFSTRALQTGVSPLVALHRGEARLHEAVNLAEDTAAGIAPRFQEDGFVKPQCVPLVSDGQACGLLVSPRSAREYGLRANGCHPGEGPEALAMAPGHLPEARVLETLGTGVYVSDLHYLNYSDRQACRMTGLTRFACFWVEDARVVAPIEVMRFDDSLIRLLGEGLVALTDHAEVMPDARTYGSRQLASVTAPGALVDGFRLTL